MGKLLDEIHSIPPSAARLGVCKITQYLNTLDKETAADFQAGLDSELSAYDLSAVLAKFSINVGQDLIRDHRAKRCVCARRGLLNE